MVTEPVKAKPAPNPDTLFAGEFVKGVWTLFTPDDPFMDIQLEASDGEVCSGHKLILAARSPYLRHLITADLRSETFNGTIKLEGVTGRPLKAILTWIYTGKLLEEQVWDCIEELVQAAKLFQLPILVNSLT